MIVVGGENLVDYIQTGLDNGSPVYTAVPGGSCYNVALAVARQNQPVTYVTPISNDRLGDMVANKLIADGVILGAARSDAPTSLAVVSLSDGQPTYQFYRNGTAERQIRKSFLDKVIKSSARIFHIGSLSLIEGNDAILWESKFQALANQGIITSLDPNPRPLAVNDKPAYVARINRMIRHASVLKLSDEDLIYLTSPMALEDAFDQLCSRTSAQMVILTKGAKGALVKTRSQLFQVDGVISYPFCDAVGAGDTFMGMVLAELYKRRLAVAGIGSLPLVDLRLIVERASRAAALNCQTAGCNPPYAKDL